MLMQDIHHSAQGYVFFDWKKSQSEWQKALPVLNDYFTQGLGINEINLNTLEVNLGSSHTFPTWLPRR